MSSWSAAAARSACARGLPQRAARRLAAGHRARPPARWRAHHRLPRRTDRGAGRVRRARRTGDADQAERRRRLNAAALPVSGSLRWAWALAAGGLACVLLWASVSAHLRLSCAVRDTPYLPLCPQPGPPEGARLELRDRIARNPGRFMGLDPPAGQRKKRRTVRCCRERPRWRRTMPACCGGAPWRRCESGRVEAGRGAAHPVCCSTVTTPEARPPGGPAVHRARRARPAAAAPAASCALAAPVLAALPPQKIPPGRTPCRWWSRRCSSGALPPESPARLHALAEGGRLLAGRLRPVAGAARSRRFRCSTTAASTQPFQADGFDWEFSTGAPQPRRRRASSSTPLARRGLVLEIEFTGRAFARPVAAPVRIRAAGQLPAAGRIHGVQAAIGRRPGVEGGLRAAGQRRPSRRSDRLQDTGGVWKPMEIEFTVPPDCGPWPASSSTRGRVRGDAPACKGRIAFDNFSLRERPDSTENSRAHARKTSVL